MRKTALYVAAWFAAGLGAVTLATAGVSMVGRQVTGERPSSLSAQEVRAQLGRDDVEPAPSTTLPPTTSTTAAATTVPGAEPGSGPGSGGGPTVSPSPPGASPTVATTGGDDSGDDIGGDDRDDTPETTATTSSAPSETRTYSMVGGTATLRFSATGVTVVVASPNAGFSVVQEPTHDSGVRVEFRNDDHRSRVEGWWDDGPRDEVEEQD